MRYQSVFAGNFHDEHHSREGLQRRAQPSPFQSSPREDAMTPGGRGIGAKRKRQDGDVLSIQIESQDVRSGVAKEFKEAHPYRHCVLKDVCDEKL